MVPCKHCEKYTEPINDWMCQNIPQLNKNRNRNNCFWSPPPKKTAPKTLKTINLGVVVDSGLNVNIHIKIIKKTNQHTITITIYQDLKDLCLSTFLLCYLTFSWCMCAKNFPRLHPWIFWVYYHLGSLLVTICLLLLSQLLDVYLRHYVSLTSCGVGLCDQNPEMSDCFYRNS